MSATQKILKHLQSGKKITHISALNTFGVYRLADTIWKLRKRGYSIETMEKKRGNKTYAEYRMDA
jgi:hypothetical protein